MEVSEPGTSVAGPGFADEILLEVDTGAVAQTKFQKVASKLLKLVSSSEQDGISSSSAQVDPGVRVLGVVALVKWL